jgi:hypothetical protein
MVSDLREWTAASRRCVVASRANVAVQPRWPRLAIVDDAIDECMHALAHEQSIAVEQCNRGVGVLLCREDVIGVDGYGVSVQSCENNHRDEAQSNAQAISLLDADEASSR